MRHLRVWWHVMPNDRASLCEHRRHFRPPRVWAVDSSSHRGYRVVLEECAKPLSDRPSCSAVGKGKKGTSYVQHAPKAWILVLS